MEYIAVFISVFIIYYLGGFILVTAIKVLTFPFVLYEKFKDIKRNKIISEIRVLEKIGNIEQAQIKHTELKKLY